MFSVIFPTMWKFEPFFSFLEELVNHYLVGEVVIVDNNSSQRPDYEILKHPKIKLLDFGQNLYVNPSWNRAVEASSFDKLCICNDDIIFDLRIFSKAKDHVTPELGIMGISAAPWAEYITHGQIEIKNFERGDGQWGFSLLFFMHKSNYEPVPETFRLFFGDNFVFDNCVWRGLPVKIIKHLWFFTPTGGGTTVSQLPDYESINLNVEDALAYRDLLYSKGITDPYSWTPSIKLIFEKFAPQFL